MIYLPDPVEAISVKKLNRFLCQALVDGRIILAHIPNTGRLTELMVEVKSVTLVEKGIARFPDAPTVRGRSYVDTLANLAKGDYKCSAPKLFTTL